jgi:hypothetical protein
MLSTESHQRCTDKQVKFNLLDERTLRAPILCAKQGWRSVIYRKQAEAYIQTAQILVAMRGALADLRSRPGVASIAPKPTAE